VVVLVEEGKVDVSVMVVSLVGRREEQGAVARILSRDTGPLFSRRHSMTSLS